MTPHMARSVCNRVSVRVTNGINVRVRNRVRFRLRNGVKACVRVRFRVNVGLGLRLEHHDAPHGQVRLQRDSRQANPYP